MRGLPGGERCVRDTPGASAETKFMRTLVMPRHPSRSTDQCSPREAAVEVLKYINSRNTHQSMLGLNVSWSCRPPRAMRRTEA